MKIIQFFWNKTLPNRCLGSKVRYGLVEVSIGYDTERVYYICFVLVGFIEMLIWYFVIEKYKCNSLLQN